MQDQFCTSSIFYKVDQYFYIMISNAKNTDSHQSIVYGTSVFGVISEIGRKSVLLPNQ